MKIVFIGAGNLATNLSKALYRAGHEILQVYSRTAESAQMMADLFECSATVSLDDVRTDADMYIFSVKDSVLEQLACTLAARIKDRLFVHTAGSMQMDVLPVERRGVLYPMQSFSKTKEVNFREIPVFIEANKNDDLAVLRQLSESISDRVYEMSSDDRKYLHLSAVFCCNFANHCSNLCLSSYPQQEVRISFTLSPLEAFRKNIECLLLFVLDQSKVFIGKSNIINISLND